MENLVTKQMAYNYLKDKGTMCRYCGNFSVVDIFKELSRPGINEHFVIRCEYSVGYKNVHIDLSKFENWIRERREGLLDEILK